MDTVNIAPREKFQRLCTERQQNKSKDALVASRTADEEPYQHHTNCT